MQTSTVAGEATSSGQALQAAQHACCGVFALTDGLNEYHGDSDNPCAQQVSEHLISYHCHETSIHIHRLQGAPKAAGPWLSCCPDQRHLQRRKLVCQPFSTGRPAIGEDSQTKTLRAKPPQEPGSVLVQLRGAPSAERVIKVKNDSPEAFLPQAVIVDMIDGRSSLVRGEESHCSGRSSPMGI